MARFQESNSLAESGPSQEDERVEVYDLNCRGHVGIVAGLLDTFHKAFAPCEDEDQQFLDIGCGTGRLTVECLFQRCPPCRRIVAVDKSAAMLKFAVENYQHPKIDYLPLDIVQDVEEFVSEQGRFQRVYSFLTLNWIQDQRQCLNNIEKLMAPRGECILLFKRSVHFFHLFEAMMKSKRWSKYTQVLEDMIPATATLNDVASLREYARNLLESTRLMTLTCEVFVSPTALRWTREKLTESLLSFNPVYPLLDDKEKEDLKDFIKDFAKTFSVDTFNGNPINRTYLFIHACTVHGNNRSDFDVCQIRYSAQFV
ncbi:hypothetical protein MTO96_042172 [Rhipicephalus appendiculatus]